MTTESSNVTQDEIRDYTSLTQTIFPGELDRPTEQSPAQGLHLEQEKARKWPYTDRPDGQATSDFESEIVALAHRINREKKLVMPTATITGPDRARNAATPSSRYPQIPLDKETEHAIIWRTTEAIAENHQNAPPPNRKHHTSTSYDDDLEPALPPGLGRDVTQWMNRVMMNLAARTPAITRPPAAPGKEPGARSDLPSLGWEDVLKALSSDIQTSDEKELNERITRRVKARFAEQPTTPQQDVSQEAPSGNEAVARLQERQAVLDQSLKRRQALEEVLWDENEGLDRRNPPRRKRRKDEIQDNEQVDMSN